MFNGGQYQGFPPIFTLEKHVLVLSAFDILHNPNLKRKSGRFRITFTKKVVLLFDLSWFICDRAEIDSPWVLSRLECD